VELLVIGVVVAALIAVLGLAAALISFVVWLVLLPLQIIGFVFKFLGFVLAVPIMMAVGLVVVAAIAFGAMFLIAPLLPLILVALGLVWLFRRPGRPHVHSSAQPTA
jgi:hypothetical protein